MPSLQGPACVSLGEVLQGQQGSLLQPTWGTRHCWGGPHFPAHTAQGHTAGWPTTPPAEAPSSTALGSLGHVQPWGIRWLVARRWHLFTSLQRG